MKRFKSWKSLKSLKRKLETFKVMSDFVQIISSRSRDEGKKSSIFGRKIANRLSNANRPSEGSVTCPVGQNESDRIDELSEKNFDLFDVGPVQFERMQRTSVFSVPRTPMCSIPECLVLIELKINIFVLKWFTKTEKFVLII